MAIESYLGAPKQLSEWVTTCLEAPGMGYWLVYKDPSGDVHRTLATEMYPITSDTSDMSDKEYEDFENSIDAGGYSRFLNLDQLEDVIANLKMQKLGYSQSDLMNAIEHYMARDAFIILEGG